MGPTLSLGVLVVAEAVVVPDADARLVARVQEALGANSIEKIWA